MNSLYGTMSDMQTAGKTNILSLDRAAMEAFFADMGEPPFRARQVLKWIYQKRVAQFSMMTDISKTLRHRLMQETCYELPELVQTRQSTDGTVKWLVRLDDGNSVETVYIPESDRGTLCVSSQVGCSLNCSFCATARQGFNRNLRVDEIIVQLLLARESLQEMSGSESACGRRYDIDADRPITNVVMMGMGEPLLNYENVVPALRLMMDDYSFGISRRRVTLSTAGVVPAMDRLSKDCPVSLAVSLHAPDNSLRNELVPLNRKYPIEALLGACRRFVQQSARQRVTFEYVMLKDVNDSDRHARKLAALLGDLPCKINLIPFNPVPGIRYRTSDPERISRFQDLLHRQHMVVIVRKTRGEDIDAACGQLAGDFKDRTRRSERLRKQEVMWT